MSVFRHAKLYVKNQAKYAHLNAFNSVLSPDELQARNVVSNPDTFAEQDADLTNKPIAIKDNICTKDFKTTASSGILKDFTSPYDATVVQLLRDAEAVVMGKTNMDEFGMGSHSTHSIFGPVKMQRYEGEEVSAGGSSGGSALAVASAQCWAALGTDTGGSVRLPAAYTGVCGFKPSYGLLSRWGVIAYANSLDTVGIFARNGKDLRTIFHKLNIYDPKDPTSLPPSTRARFCGKTKARSLKIGIPLDYNIATLHPDVRAAWIKSLKHFAKHGHTLHPVRLPTTRHALPAYYVLAPAEASSNLAKYDGVRYGCRTGGIDGTPDSVLFAKTRGQSFGSEVQRRILLGTFSLSAEAIDNYFIQAQKVRRLVQQDFNKVFTARNPLFDDTSPVDEIVEKVDVLVCPTAPSPAPKLSDVEDQGAIHSYMNDVFTVPASLAGLPAVNVPVLDHASKDHERDLFTHTVGMQIIGQYGSDKLVLDCSRVLQTDTLTPLVCSGLDTTAWGDSIFEERSSEDRKRHGLRALDLGISILEAKALAELELQKRRQDAEAKLLEERGEQGLETTATLCDLSRTDYMGLFLGQNDPVGAERKFSHFVDSLGRTRLHEAALLCKQTKCEYVWRFFNSSDPLIEERALFTTLKEKRERSNLRMKRKRTQQGVQHGEEPEAVW